MKKNNKKGFTLAELLIVVAIIAVLTAIAIPVFTSQLEKSREATDKANIRSAYAELIAGYLEKDEAKTINVPVAQNKDNWQADGSVSKIVIAAGTSTGGVSVKAKTSGTYAVAISDAGVVTVS